MEDNNRLIEIKAIGSFLLNYHNMLHQHFMIKKLLHEPNLSPKFHIEIKKFLIEWKVIWNIDEEKQVKLIETIFDFLKYEVVIDENSIDKLVNRIISENISENKLISLGSKILFIYSPEKIFPYDKLAKTSLKINNNNYSLFYKKVIEFKKEKNTEKIYSQIIKDNKRYTDIIENSIIEEFKDEFKLNITDDFFVNVKINRIVDKLLWVDGSTILQNKKTKIKDI